MSISICFCRSVISVSSMIASVTVVSPSLSSSIPAYT